MAIDRMRVRNITVFEEVDINFCKGINVFIGENGTGKTHLLKMLYEIPAIGLIEYNLRVGNNPIEASRVYPNLIFVRQKGIRRGETTGACRLYFGQSYYELALKSDGETDLDGNEQYKLNHRVDEELAKIFSRVIFIPSKDMLTHSRGLLSMSEKYSKDMPFEGTLLDIIKKAGQWKVDHVPDLVRKILPLLEDVIEGTVVYENDTFYILKRDGSKVDFFLEAEGHKKIGLLWQLLMNESIAKDSVLVWDEPEANLNPKLIPVVAKVLLELARYDVQIFIATHDYNLMKYISILKKQGDQVAFLSLFKSGSAVTYENAAAYDLLRNNAIVDANTKMYKDGIAGVL